MYLVKTLLKFTDEKSWGENSKFYRDTRSFFLYSNSLRNYSNRFHDRKPRSTSCMKDAPGAIPTRETMRKAAQAGGKGVSRRRGLTRKRI